MPERNMDEDILTFESQEVDAFIPNRFVMNPYTTYLRQTGNEILLQTLALYSLMRNSFDELMVFDQEGSNQRHIYVEEVEQDVKALTKNYKPDCMLVLTFGGYINIFHFNTQFERDQCFFFIKQQRQLTFFDRQLEYLSDGDFEDLFDVNFST